MEGQSSALSLAEKAVCKVVYGAPRPRPLLLPVGLELWLYVQKMRNMRRKRWASLAASAGSSDIRRAAPDPDPTGVTWPHKTPVGTSLGLWPRPF